VVAAGGPVIPPREALRIAAQCRGAVSYMPRFLPGGFALASWKARSHNVPCDEGPLVIFEGRGRSLVWQVGDARPFARPRCGRRASERHRFKRVHGEEFAWRCVRKPFPLVLLVRQSAKGERPARADLERMVASARPLPPGKATERSYELVPRARLLRLERLFARPVLLPRRLPAGFIFSTAQVEAKNRFHPRLLDITFGRDGLVVEWTVQAGADDFYCPSKATRERLRDPLGPSEVVHGRRVFYLVGIHGGSAWTCLRRQAVGNAMPVGAELWYDIRLDSVAMRRKLRQIVGTARVVR